jgi:undecaprenyl-diphosphatase
MLENIIEIFILSLIQGVSEFLPISSSSHLIIISTLYEFKSSSLLIDISLHLGSLFAILFFYKTDIFNFKSNKKFISLIFFGSIPLIIFGFIVYITGLIELLRDFKIIAWTTIPGVSRAGIVITGARFLKYNRTDSAKISFLLSIPALCGASVLSFNDILKQSVDFNYLVILAIVLSFFFSFITVKFFLNFIKKFSMNIFVVYRIALGLVLLFLVY